MRTGPNEVPWAAQALPDGPASFHLAGDANCDDVVDQFDIEPFVLALARPAEYETLYPDCDRRAADCNTDGRIDAFDIDPFITLLTGQ